MHARAYLRATTVEQDASRAREQIEAFAAERGLPIVGIFVENESGAKLARPELFRLLADSQAGRRAPDRASRPPLAPDRLPTGGSSAPNWTQAGPQSSRSTCRQAGNLRRRPMSSPAACSRAINAMLLDMLAAVARKDYEDRRRRQAQGIAKAKPEGAYRGRPRGYRPQRWHRRDAARRLSWSAIQAATGCRRATIAKVAKRAA